MGKKKNKSYIAVEGYDYLSSDEKSRLLSYNLFYCKEAYLKRVNLNNRDRESIEQCLSGMLVDHSDYTVYFEPLILLLDDNGINKLRQFNTIQLGEYITRLFLFCKRDIPMTLYRLIDKYFNMDLIVRGKDIHYVEDFLRDVIDKLKSGNGKNPFYPINDLITYINGYIRDKSLIQENRVVVSAEDIKSDLINLYSLNDEYIPLYEALFVMQKDIRINFNIQENKLSFEYLASGKSENDIIFNSIVVSTGFKKIVVDTRYGFKKSLSF